MGGVKRGKYVVQYTYLYYDDTLLIARSYQDEDNDLISITVTSFSVSRTRGHVVLFCR